MKCLDACIANKSTWSIVHHHKRRNWTIKENKVQVCFHFVYIIPCGWLSWRGKEVKNHCHTNPIMFMKIFADNVDFTIIEDLIHYAHIDGVQQQIEDGKYFLRLSYIFLSLNKVVLHTSILFLIDDERISLVIITWFFSL